MKNFTLFLIAFLLVWFGNQRQTTAQEFWGMTSQGGSSNIGVIFKTDASGNNQIPVYSFIKEYEGAFPRYVQLVQTSNGKLYGMTTSGGTNNIGVLFEYDPANNTYTKKLDFDGTVKGSGPFGSLMLASNGKLYGMTYQGGAGNFGVLFEYNPATSTYSKKLDFDGSAKGSYPQGSLIQASNGKLYGMTYQGGTGNFGVLFEYDPSTSTYTKKIDFDGSTKGSNPLGSLMQASNLKLYGMTTFGGTNDLGVLFEFDPATNAYTKKLDFDGYNNGSRPTGSLMQASNGKLYGMTLYGGTGSGVLFEYDPATNSYTKKLDFDGAAKGRNPYGSLMQATNGNLYGMTYTGGTSNYGVLFEYDPATNNFSKKINFDDTTKGRSPWGSLMQASNGRLYGMTYQGGTNNMGVLFEYNPATNAYTKKLDFLATGTEKGSAPFGSLIKAANGKLYGMTYLGGTYNGGVLFEYDPATNTYIKKIDFDGTSKGANPYGRLIQASNGKLYGMTYQGGTNSYGVLFEYDPATNTYTKKLDFDGTAKGRLPVGSLIQASNGKLYGMTKYGGASDNGVLFEYDLTTNTYTKILDFDGTAKGRSPNGSLMQASNGKLYGITRNGGMNNLGVLFEFDPASNTYTKKLDFDGTSKGSYPDGDLMQACNNKLYGMTTQGGASNIGVMFEYDPATNTYIKKLDFDGVLKGNEPHGSLIQASNGKLYGMTYRGGIGNQGVLFQYDLATNTYTKKLDCTSSTGIYPLYNALIEVGGSVAPVAVCKNATLQLNATGQATLLPSAIDGGSTGLCISLSVSKTNFTCADVGNNTVTLTVTDVNNNTSTCNATVTVVDGVAPVAIAQNVTVQLDASGNGSTTAALVDNGSSDACGIKSLALSKTAFNCTDIAGNPNVVTLTVTDNNNNVSTTTATVTVVDGVAPVAIARNVTVQLDASGNGSTTAALVDNGSSDACGIKSLALSKTAFNCTDIAGNPNVVTLTVTDNNNNVSTTTATVTVVDAVAPVAIAQNVTVQLDAAGNGTTTAALVDNGSNDACGIKSLVLSKTAFNCTDIAGNPNTVTLTVTDNNNNVSTTTATVTVVDAVAPVAIARNVTVQLDAAGNGSTTAALVDNGSNDACGIKSLVLSKTAFNCTDIAGNPNVVTLTITDNNNNVSTTTATVTVVDAVAPVAITQNVTVQLDAAGNGTTTAALVDNGSSDACGIKSLVLSKTAFNCTDIATNPNVVTLTVTDNNNNVSTANANVTVVDGVAPVAIAQNVTVQLDAAGKGTTTAALVDNGSSDACGIKSLVLSKTAFNCTDIATNPNVVTLTVTDNNDNVSTATANVTVVDGVAPVAIAQNVTVQLDAADNGTTTAALVDNGSSDACGIKSLVLSKTAFNCTDIATNPNVVTLTVTDNNNNVSTANANVTVVDGVAPVAIAQNVTVQLDAAGKGTTTAALVDNGSSDACGIKSLVLSKTAFNCTDIATNPNVVTLTVTDNNDNVSTATANVTVVDGVAPVAIAQNVTVQLDAADNGTTTAALVDNGSSDACGIKSLVLSKTAFTCTDIATNPNVVTLTVTDNNNNVSTANANVTVVDGVAPVAIAQNVTVQLDAAGNGTTTAALVDNGSNDACGIKSLALSKTAFNCTDIAGNPNVVTLTVTDNNNNVSTTTATVTVVDGVAPIAIAQNVIVQLDAAGNGTTTAALVDNGSSDACGIALLTLDKTAFSCADIATNPNQVVLTVTDNNGNESTCTSIVTVKDNFHTVELKDSKGNYLSGGILNYYDEGWKTAYENSNGIFRYSSTKSMVSLKMYYEGGTKQVNNIPTDQLYLYETKNISIEFRKADGTLGHEGGKIEYYASGWKTFGTTNAGGTASKELLPITYSFKMDYLGGTKQISNYDTSNNPIVKFQTTNVVVELRKADGTLGHEGGKIEYYASGWKTFGTTNAGGTASKELLPITYSFKMDYLGGTKQISNYDTSNNPIVKFQTTNVVVELRKADGTLGHEGGKIEYYASGWKTFGTTNAGGTASKELLPITYSFKMDYLGGTKQISNYDTSNNPIVKFQTTNVVVELRKADGTLGHESGKIEYYASGWKTFGTTNAGGTASKELLPITYSFKMDYLGGTKQISNYDTSNNPIVKFQTTNVVVELRKADGTLGHEGGKIEYYASGWKTFGTTNAGGTASKELLPITYSFKMDYLGGTKQISNYDTSNNPIVKFQTTNVVVELRKADGTLGINGGDIKYYASGWKTFGTTGDSGLGSCAKELLPISYSFKLTYNEKTYQVLNHETGNDAIVEFYENYLKTAFVPNVINSSDVFNNYSITSVLNVIVYPNPTKGKVNIDLENYNDQEVKVEIFNMIGQKVFINTFNTGGHIELNLTGNTTGIYLLNIIVDKNRFVKKINLQERSN